VHPKGAPSAFHSFSHDEKHSFSGDLPVKEQFDVGTETSPARSYLQLDLEAATSTQKLQREGAESPPAKASGVGPIDSLRSSLAMIWNSKPFPSRQIEQHNEASCGRESTDPLVPAASQSKAASLPNDAREGQATMPRDQDACCQVPPESGAGAIDSLRSSLMMIWNSKPRPTIKAQEGLTSTLTSSAKSMDLPSTSLDSQEEGRSFDNPSNSTDKQRDRTDGLSSARQKLQLKETRMSMGIQYLPSSQQLRSLSRERTITPIPSGDELYSCGLLGENRRRNSSFDSVEDLHVNTSRGTPDPYRLGSSYRSSPLGSDYRMSPNVSSLSKASPRGSSYKASPNNGQACKMSPNSCSSYKASPKGSVYKSSPKESPSSIKPAPTTETENSFIHAALKARNANDVVVIYSGTPETKGWHPPEQERQEHDTMVRAILERPSLIDKSTIDPFQPKHLDWRKVRKWTLVTMAMLFFAAVIAGCLACGITGNCTGRNVNDEGGEEEFQPLVLTLPEYTQESLKSMHSAQSKAYTWLENDPYRNTYSDSRKLQRFALASLYYSTRIAQNWTVSTSWLSYDVHECYWFSSYAGKDVCEGDQIKHLVLTKNNLRGNIPPELALLTPLVELDLSRNVLIGPIPEQLQALTALEHLWLEKNELNGDIPSQIGIMTSLKTLTLATNDLEGTLPSEVSALTNLQTLRLFYNSLSGTVPNEIGHLTALEVLDVDVNNLSGTIPTQLSLLMNLTELWLDWNSFVGPIPTELGLLSNLKKLYLGRVFVGESLRNADWKDSGNYQIPTQLGLLTNIEELYLDNNDLTGMIPTQLSALTNLQIATLDNNFLKDSISPGICSLFGGQLDSLTIDCSEVFCSCGCTCV
jgi:Leucine-rich repeat (LRR) protein